ncbi:MAG: insulinase family protein [bacterium]|nr:insulinase family protein [bacterium]
MNPNKTVAQTGAGRRWVRLTGLLATTILLWSMPKGALGELPQPVASVEGITAYHLDNGLEVLLFRDPSKPTVTVNVTYKVGSRHEGRGEAGMAHLLEHMVFKGTPTHTNIWGALEDHGANFNGTTWVDRTNYFETLPATDANLEFALRMEADRMVNSTISGEDLAKEMTVVRNEFEMGENNPVGVLSERMLSAAYLWHNYGKSTIGNRSDIERVPVENLRRFYQRNYQPDNATLVVAGKFDKAKTLALIVETFGAIPKPKRALDKTHTEEPAQDGSRLVTLKRVGEVAAAGLVYHIPAGPDAEFPAVQVMAGVLTDQPSGRLYKALVESGLATSVEGSAYSWAEPSVLEIMAQVSPGKKPQEVLDKMTEVVEGLAATPIADEEVDRIKTRRLNYIKMGMNNSGRVGVRLSEAIAQGDWRLFFIHRDRLKQVKAADLKQVAQRYLVEANRTAGLFIPTEQPTRSTVPPRPDVVELVRNFKGSETIAEGEAFVATPENIEKRTRRLVLPSGIKVALLSRESRGDAVRASFKFHYGTADALRGQETALGLVSSMLMRGTRDRNYQQLRDAIDQLESRIFVGGGGGRGGRRGGRGGGGLGSFVASIESDRTHIVAAIELLGEILQQPAFDPAEFEVVVKNRQSRLERSLSDPRALGMNALSRAMNPWPADSIHYVPTIEEQIERLKSVSLGSIRDLYSRHYGAGHVEVAVLGDFEEAQIEAALEKVFGGWKSPAPYERIAKEHRPIESASLSINTPDKEMATVAMGTTFEMRDDDPDYPALLLANYVFGQSAKSRLINRLRHEGGLSYGAGASLRVDRQDRRASLTGTAICAPQNAAEALSALREEFTKWIAEGITEEELADARTSYALQFENTLANDRFVLGELTNGLEIDRTFAYRAEMLAKIQTLTKADIQRVLAARLKDAPFVEMQAGDLERAAAPDEGDAAAKPEQVSAAEQKLPERLAQFDKNADGKLQESEMPERMRTMFGRLDTNGDGAIDAQEAAAMSSGRGGRNLWQRIERYDTDKDQKLTRKELPEHFQRMIEHLDTNKDGALDKAEVDAAVGGQGKD